MSTYCYLFLFVILGFRSTAMENWKSLNIRTEILNALKLKNFAKPTKIQSESIPPAIDDQRDILGAAETGSGKTLAFALPILQKLWEEPYGIFALILTPTRELAYQVN